ncbi:hypothetical protein DPMN_038333 [Dreissena polymorpha]|uniref:Uncharacterized protein n=1 Tax=Dreissena polymorpha TaxID=45954 RepID=A0A9D4RN31_DREPO|nr:hypothetical protein DPMN_038333 [Dreissena polymorpha]
MEATYKHNFSTIPSSNLKLISTELIGRSGVKIWCPPSYREVTGLIHPMEAFFKSPPKTPKVLVLGPRNSISNK